MKSRLVIAVTKQQLLETSNLYEPYFCRNVAADRQKNRKKDAVYSLTTLISW